MTKIGQQAALMLFAAFLLLGAGRLISGPEEAPADAPPPRAVHAVLRACIPDVPEAHAEAPRPHPSAARMRMRPQMRIGAAPAAESAANGWPITGRTFSRTVYTVCPPEGIPG